MFLTSYFYDYSQLTAREQAVRRASTVTEVVGGMLEVKKSDEVEENASAITENSVHSEGAEVATNTEMVVPEVEATDIGSKSNEANTAQDGHTPSGSIHNMEQIEIETNSVQDTEELTNEQVMNISSRRRTIRKSISDVGKIDNGIAQRLSVLDSSKLPPSLAQHVPVSRRNTEMVNIPGTEPLFCYEKSVQTIEKFSKPVVKTSATMTTIDLNPPPKVVSTATNTSLVKQSTKGTMTATPDPFSGDKFLSRVTM